MHATSLELERYLGQRLDDAAVAALERHCDGCDACAEALAREARLEVGLRRLFAEQRCGTSAEGDFDVPAPQPEQRSPPRSAFWVLAAAACAALALLAVHPRAAPRPPTDSAPALSADAGDGLIAPRAESPVRLDGDLAHGTP